MIVLLGQIRSLLKELKPFFPISQLALHCHDTYGQALANIWASIDVCSPCLLPPPLPCFSWSPCIGRVCRTRITDIVSMLHSLTLHRVCAWARVFRKGSALLMLPLRDSGAAPMPKEPVAT